MLIKCLYNKIEELPSNLFQQIVGKMARFDPEELSVGMLYKVYAFCFQNNLTIYLVQTERMNYPTWLPSQFFEVIDEGLSTHWIINPGMQNKEDVSVVVGFKEYVHDQYFYAELIDDHLDYIEKFNYYKSLIDKEEPAMPWCNSDQLDLLYEKWLMCKKCEEVWEESSLDALCSCPKCNKHFVNPFYVVNGEFIFSKYFNK